MLRHQYNKMIRKELGLTQTYIAKKLDVTQAYISKYEANKFRGSVKGLLTYRIEALLDREIESCLDELTKMTCVHLVEERTWA